MRAGGIGGSKIEVELVTSFVRCRLRRRVER
jgi:hypothetical protein